MLATNVLAGKLEEKRQLKILGANGRLLLKVDRKEIGYGDMDWFQLDRD
jgi:hypothetical protein